jgi:GT2 family glycosyltransferase
MTEQAPNNAHCTPVCSVCIANFNGLDVLSPCLDSVLSQKTHFPLEILVHDDASTDGSAAFIRERYPAVKLIESPVNSGFCASNNRMAAAAAGRYLLLLNNDATLFPGALQALFEEAVQLGKPAILGLPQFDQATGKLIDRGSLLDPFLNAVPNLDEKRPDVGVVIGACLWIPKATWEELGGFPEWFGSLAEDTLLCLQARLRGYPVRVVNAAGFSHRVGHSLGGGRVNNNRLQTNLKRRALSERNRSFVMALCYPAPFFQFMLPLHMLALLAEGAMLSLLKRDGKLLSRIYWAAIAAVWRERRRLGEIRRVIQNKRSASRGDFFSVFTWAPYKLKMLIRHGLPDIRSTQK